MRFLVVDDDIASGQYINDALSSVGEVDLYFFGPDVVARVQPYASYDVIFVDYNMSPINGFELIQELEAKGVSKPENTILIFENIPLPEHNITHMLEKSPDLRTFQADVLAYAQKLSYAGRPQQP